MNFKVAVSVGHYLGEENKDEEYPANRKYATLLHNFLVLNGYTADIFEGHLQEKVTAVNAYKPDIAIECHFNALHYPYKEYEYGSGFECLCWQGSVYGKTLATRIVDNFQKKLPVERRGKYGIWERRDLYFLKHTHMPAVIPEPLFLDNPIESNFIHMKRGFEFIAEATYEGVNDYFKEINQAGNS